jgi:hypothetical protein
MERLSRLFIAWVIPGIWSEGGVDFTSYFTSTSGILVRSHAKLIQHLFHAHRAYETIASYIFRS